MRSWSILVAAVLLAGCAETGPDRGPEEAGPPQGEVLTSRTNETLDAPWSWDDEGDLVGAGYCDASRATFVGLSTFYPFEVPAGTRTMYVNLTWDVPVPLCLNVHSPTGEFAHLESDPLQPTGELRLEVAAGGGEAFITVMAKGPGPVTYNLHVAGT